MFKKKNVLIGLLVICIMASPVSAADWQMFHENQAHTGFLKEAADFSPQTWYFQTEGPVKSSAAILNNILYLGSDDGSIYSIDMENGNKLWDYKTDGAIISSPVIQNKTLYVGSKDGYLYAINTDNGDVEWKFKTGNSIESTPSVENNTVYVGSNDGQSLCY